MERVQSYINTEERVSIREQARAAMRARAEAFEFNGLVLIDGEWWQEREGIVERIPEIPPHIYGSRPRPWPWEASA